MRNESIDLFFCDRIRAIIGLVGSMKELSRLSGVSAQVIRDYLTGKADPTRRKLINLANAVGVTVEWLSTGVNPMMQGEEDKISAKLIYFIVEALEDHLESVKNEICPQDKAAIISLSYQFSPRYNIDSIDVKNNIQKMVLLFYETNEHIKKTHKSANGTEKTINLMFKLYLEGSEPMQGLASINKYLREAAINTDKECQFLGSKGADLAVDDIKKKTPSGDKKG